MTISCLWALTLTCVLYRILYSDNSKMDFQGTAGHFSCIPLAALSFSHSSLFVRTQSCDNVGNESCEKNDWGKDVILRINALLLCSRQSFTNMSHLSDL